MSNNARKIAEQEILVFMDEIDPTGVNTEKWKEILSGWDDKTFHNYAEKVSRGEATLVIFAFSFMNDDLSTENNLKIAEKYGIPMFEQLRITGKPGVPDHITFQESQLLDIQVKRQSQNIDHKTSVPSSNRVIDQMTYQPTGESKGSKLSLPEARSMDSMGLNNCLEEFWRARGGDKGMFRAMNQMAEQTGSISLRSISPYATGVESNKAVKEYFFGRLIAYED